MRLAHRDYLPDRQCCLVGLIVGLSFLLLMSFGAMAAPAVSNVSASLPGAARYEPYVIDFDVSTCATNPYWPYDASPPPSVPVGTGVTVDGLFSRDNWATTITVPAFYFQDYQRRLVSGDGSSYSDEAEVPIGRPHWRLCFAPPESGEWSYKIRVTDASGTTEATDPEKWRFSCAASACKGFVRASRSDCRYFELSDGTPVVGAGVNLSFRTTYEADQALATCGSNGVKIVRWWLNYRGWQNPFGGGDVATYGGPQWDFSLKTLSRDGGRKVGDRYSAAIARGGNTKQSVFLTAGLTYRFSGYIRTSGLVAASGGGAIPYIGPVSGVARVGDSGWSEFSLDYTATSDGKCSIGVKNTGTDGTAYLDDVCLVASSDGGATWSADYLSKGDFDSENYIDLKEAWKADRIFEAARQHGVYLKTVVSEKQDSSLGCIGADGTAVTRSDSNFYASATHPSRWLQKAWWRYMTARWGCYTSLHSWELCNEGDPFSASHYDAANALADYVHSVDPNRAMCTTSFWHSIPMEFWKTSSCDYLDVHEYIGPNTPGTASHGPRYLAWVDGQQPPAENSTGVLAFGAGRSDDRSKCIEITAKAVSNTASITTVSQEYHIGVDPGHTYTLRYWAKARDVANRGGDAAGRRPGLFLVWSKAYHENDFVGQITSTAPLGTYDWQQIVSTDISPPAAANTCNISFVSTCCPDHESSFWIDDVEFIDETTGKNLFVDGSFEGDRIDYDTALAVRKYGVLLNSYGSRASKPTIWGETGIRGPNELGSPYKGYSYTEENQHLVDDTTGLYVKKMIWAHAGPDSPYMLLWWTDNISKKALWHYFRAFQLFMAGIPVSNGHYVDVGAATSAASLRAWGQKDLTSNCAHLWIDNAPYTWKNVVDGVSVPVVSGTVTIPGLKDGSYQIDWWDTGSGVVTKTEYADCVGGQLVLAVANLQSDTACRIRPKPAKVDLRVLASPSNATAGQTVTITVEFSNQGETEARNVAAVAKVPVGMTYVNGSADSAGSYDASKREVSWVIDAVAAHGTATRTFRAVVE